MKSKFGPDHYDTLMGMNNLATVYGEGGRHEQSRSLHEQTLALGRAQLGPDHPETLTEPGEPRYELLQARAARPLDPAL